MKITIIATHSFPIPYRIHTGDMVILDLAIALKDKEHDVTMIAPEGTLFGQVKPMRASYGAYPPSSNECEIEAFDKYKDFLLTQDIVLDFSITKEITHRLNLLGFMKTCCVVLGGVWNLPFKPHNLIAVSDAQRDRLSRGETDFIGTPTPDLAGPPGMAVECRRRVWLGIDTYYYHPTDYAIGDYFLWMGRWHEVRGYKMAIELAKKTGFNVMLAGEHPDNEEFESQRKCALEAVELCKGYKNLYIQWLPKDPNHHQVKVQLYRRARAFLYTVQFHEPFGLMQIESLSCGRPVIATNYGSMPEIIKNDVTGFVVENNIDEFVKAMKKVSTLIPRACRRDAIGRFDLKIMAKKFLFEFEKIVEENK